jgi:lipoprotein-anchoring transpeptidase ErfK/SrfK
LQEAKMGFWRKMMPGALAALLMVVGSVEAGAAQSLRLVADLDDRTLHVYEDGRRTDSYPISVGQAGHRTPTGEFRIHRIDWNPDWTPPDSEWAEDAEYKAPGEEGNPMGRVRMVYRAPYSIHGTEDLASLGEAESHGSVRMANEDIIALARRVMAAGGVERSASWFDDVLADPETMVEVELPDPVELENRRDNGGGDDA